MPLTSSGDGKYGKIEKAFYVLSLALLLLNSKRESLDRGLSRLIFRNAPHSYQTNHSVNPTKALRDQLAAILDGNVIVDFVGKL